MLTSLSLALSACHDKANDADLTNAKATIPTSFNFSKLGLKVITSSINKKQGTMSTLYGDPIALSNAEAVSKVIAPNEVLALVTWKQQADKHWFGANIPGSLQSIEMIKTISAGTVVTVHYQRFEGKDLNFHADTLGRETRIKYILGLHASIMP